MSCSPSCAVSVTVREIDGGHGGRVHVLNSPAGHLVIDYTATVTGRRDVPHGGESDLLEYRRPSRYCPSDKLLATAAREFGDIGDDAKLVAAVTAWVHDRLIYISGSSGPTDDAVDTLLLGQGVCRDYAHLVLSLLRAPTSRPARRRLRAGTRPDGLPRGRRGLGGGLAAGRRHRPRPAGVDAADATGRDAADTAFMSTHCGTLTLTEMMVTATVDDLPSDDPATVGELR